LTIEKSPNTKISQEVYDTLSLMNFKRMQQNVKKPRKLAKQNSRRRRSLREQREREIEEKAK
jgi:translation initiation factor IF-2